MGTIDIQFPDGRSDGSSSGATRRVPAANKIVVHELGAMARGISNCESTSTVFQPTRGRASPKFGGANR
jgi:hypothetical protein